MLVIRYLNPTGLFSFGRSENIDLQQRGLVNLLGENEDTGGDSNGAGKSSVFNALCEILYGENPTGVSGNGVVNQVWKYGFAGRVEFVSWEGIYYRVTYCRDWKDPEMYPTDNDNGTVYKGTELFLDKFVDGSWRDSRGSKMSQTRQILINALGVSYERFVATSYLSHRVGSRFLRGTNKERVGILTGVTGIEEWDQVLSRCRSEKSNLQSTVQAAQEEISYLKGTLEQLKTSKRNLEQTDWAQKESEYVAARDQKRNDAAAWVQEVETKEDQIQRLLQKQQEKYASSGIGTLTQEIADLEVEERSLRNSRALEQDLPSFDPILRQQVIDTKAKLDQAKGTLQAFLRTGDFRNIDECPTCGSKITKTKKVQIEKHIGELQSEIQFQDGQYADLLRQQQAKEAEIQKAREEAYRDRQQRVTEISQQVQEKKLQMQKSSSEYEQITQQVQVFQTEVARIKGLVAAAVREAEQYEEWAQSCHHNLNQLAEIEGNIQRAQDDVLSAEQRIADQLAEVEVLGWLIQNIPYIKLHKLSVALGMLSEQINRYLSEMGETVRMNLSSFDEKKVKKGAGDIKDLLKSEVSVEVIDGEKNIDPRLYSDGETSKLSNALIRALHDMAVQNGQGCNLILLDEIFAFVDQSNSEKLVGSFTNIPAGTILITDNSGHVNDLLSFNETWVARKKNGITAIEVAR